MTDKMREEFEAWAIEDAASTGKTLSFERGGEWYLGKDHQAMNLGWAAWQASREALVIELPPVRPEPIASGDELKSDGEAASWNIWVGEKLAKADCREAIEAAGLKVKP